MALIFYSQKNTGNGSNTNYTLTQTVTQANNILVSVNGLLQVPSVDYTISGSEIIFASAPLNNFDIEIRYIVSDGYDGSVGFTGSVGFIGSVGFQGSAGFLGCFVFVPSIV